MIVCLSTLVSLGLVELAFRHMHPQHGVRPCTEIDFELGVSHTADCEYVDLRSPNQNSYHVKTNNLGFRMNRDIRLGLNKENTRLLVLGDSFTYGWGVDIQHAYISLIEEEIVRNHSKLELINMGVGGYSTGHHRKQLTRWLDRLSPQGVVLFLNNNDLKDNIVKNPDYTPFSYEVCESGKVKLQARQVYSPTKRLIYKYSPHYWLVKHSHTYIALQKARRTLTTSFGDKDEVPAFSLANRLSEEEQRLAFEITVQHLQQIIAVLAPGQIPLAIVWIPNQCILADVSDCAVEFESFLSKLKELSDGHELLTTIDPSVTFRQVGATLSPEEIYLPDGHFTAEGNRLYANATKSSIRDWFTTFVATDN
jgi:hypothetical protein